MNRIRMFLKSIDVIVNFWRSTVKIYNVLLIKMSPVLASKRFYRISFGQPLDLQNPKNFFEKLTWLKLYWRHPLVSKCTDKYAVREYVEECGCESLLNELYGVYNTTDEIDWDKLPNKFVLKCTHGCDCNIICDDKSKLDSKTVFNSLRGWMKIDYSLYVAEIQYSSIKPRIICEKYIETSTGSSPIDYKIHCINGKAKLVMVCTDRSTALKYDFIDLQWNRMDIGYKQMADYPMPKKPDCFSDMLVYAEKLAKPFPFVRVDFYDYNGVPILSELTFTPYGGCIDGLYNQYGQKLLGDMLVLPDKFPHRS
jgi:hypothetical protein